MRQSRGDGKFCDSFEWIKVAVDFRRNLTFLFAEN